MRSLIVLRAGSMKPERVLRDVGDGFEVTLEQAQELVGGYIERAPFSIELDRFSVDMLCDEDGKLKGLEPSLVVVADERPLDVVCGNIVFVGRTDDEWTLLTEEQADIVMSHFALDSDGNIINVYGVNWDGDRTLVPVMNVEVDE